MLSYQIALHVAFNRVPLIVLIWVNLWGGKHHDALRSIAMRQYGQSGQIEILSGQIVAKILIIFHLHCEMNRHPHHTSSQQSRRFVLNVSQPIQTYMHGTQASQIGDSCRDVRIRSRSNREFYLHDLIRTYVFRTCILLTMILREIASPEIVSIVTLSYQSSTNRIRTY